MFWFTEPSIPPLQYPHPVITEVLYAVPTSDGDANRDGTRDSAGDEFIELVNPHARPIDLRGYTISDSGEGKARFKFTFPSVLLEPGQVVVVFNGSDARLTGPVGDAKIAPVEGHPKFHNALVFTARAQSSRSSWANKSDYALLLAPGGTPLHCVPLGRRKKAPHQLPRCGRSARSLARQCPACHAHARRRTRTCPCFHTHPHILPNIQSQAIKAIDNLCRRTCTQARLHPNQAPSLHPPDGRAPCTSEACHAAPDLPRVHRAPPNPCPNHPRKHQGGGRRRPRRPRP
jgi:hypothetical protein